MNFYKIYKQRLHFSLNFYSLFLLITFIPDLVGLPPSLASNALWAMRAVAAVLIIIYYHKKLYHLNWSEQLFLFVSIVYLINVFVDVFWKHYPVGMGQSKDFIGLFLSILVALAFRWDKSFVTNKSYFFFLASLGLGLFVAFFLAKQSPLPLIGRYDANSTVNTINYGQMGCALSLVAIYGFLNRPFKYGKIVYVFLFLLGIVSIMKAGSRSPVVVLLAVSVFYFFAKSGLLKGLIWVGFATLIFYSSIGFLVELSEAVGSGIVTRILSAIETGETSGSNYIYANAIRHFMDSPIWGSYYLIPTGIGKGGYPHNFFIEAFMTTGLIGGIPFVIMVIITVVKSFNLLKTKHSSSWVILLFLQIVVYGMFSSSLYSSQDFWALSFFILSITPTTDKKYPKQRIKRNLNTKLTFNTSNNE